MTFFEFQKRFPTELSALNFIVSIKYTNGYHCPKCGCIHKGIYRSNVRTKILHCNNCNSEFSILAYSLGNEVHTNGIESFWAIVKRGIYGIYHHVSVNYMQRYMDEFCFRLNHRKCDDAFDSLVGLALTAKKC